MGGGLALRWGRGGGCVVGGVGARVAGLASLLEGSDGAAICWGWWSVPRIRHCLHPGVTKTCYLTYNLNMLCSPFNIRSKTTIFLKR